MKSPQRHKDYGVSCRKERLFLCLNEIDMFALFFPAGFVSTQAMIEFETTI